MSNTPFMPLWIADFVADTMSMDAKETGAYILLLMAMWQHNGKLPNDPKKLKRIAKIGRDWPSIWDALSPYFEVKDDHVTQSRLVKELRAVAAKRAANAQRGALGGRAKALKSKEQGLANATFSGKQLELEPDIVKRDTNVSPKKSAKKGTRLPEDWTLPKQWGEWALQEGHSESTVRLEADKFRDYWISTPGQKGVKLDWLATWRNWMRRVGEKGGKVDGVSKYKKYASMI